MLYEIKEVKQLSGEPRRRWFFDQDVDLIVWLTEETEPWGFQLCYDKLTQPHALTWQPDTGYVHERIDKGELDGGIGRHRGTPILVPDGSLNKEALAERFKRLGEDMPSWVVRWVCAKIQRFTYPEGPSESASD